MRKAVTGFSEAPRGPGEERQLRHHADQRRHDAPAEPDALGTAACDVTKLLKREGDRLEPLDPVAERRLRDPAALPSLSRHRLDGLQLCAESLP